MDNFFKKLNPNIDQFVKQNFNDKELQVNICLIGDTGFLGKWLVFLGNELVDSKIGHVKITGFSRQFIETKYSYTFYTHKLVKDLAYTNFTEFTHIVWAASSTSRNQNYDSSNSLITYLLTKLTEQNFLGYFINLSSGAVYENSFTNTKTLEENSKLHNLSNINLSAYIRNKLFIEKQVSYFCSKNQIPFLNARLFSFCGPGMPKDDGYAMHEFFSKTLNSQDIVLTGNPKTLRSFMHPFDFAIKIYELIQRNPNVEELNIGSSELYDILKFANMISKFNNVKVILKPTDYNYEIKNYCPNIKKISELYNIKPFFSNQSMIEDTFKYYKLESNSSKEIDY